MRRTFVSRCLSLALLISAVVGCQSVEVAEPTMQKSPSANEIPLMVGTYSQKGSEGIYRLSFNKTTGKFSQAQLWGRAENPSFLINSPDYVYSVNEMDPGRVSAFKKFGDHLRLEKTTDVESVSPCYLAFNGDGQKLAVANYHWGNISVFDMENNVTKGEAKVYQHEGYGPNKSRQEGPHAHWVGWHPKDSSKLYAVDLGIDEIKLYEGADYTQKTAIKLSPGDGPRHMVFHPSAKFAFVLNELSNTLVTLAVKADGTLSEAFRVNTLPADFSEHSQAAHIEINNKGDRVYVSNRGHDSIAVFAIGSTGEATLMQHQSTQGNWPRHFALLEADQLMIVANQESNNLAAFKLQADGSLLYLNAETTVIQPTFVGKH